MAFESLEAALAEQQQRGYLRQLMRIDGDNEQLITVAGQHYLNFASNDYLGLRQHPDVLQAYVNGLATYGAGSGASPLVTGYSKAHAKLEEKLASLLQREAVLLVNSGFAANQALCQALFKDGGQIIADKLMHASFLDGARATNAEFKRFAHNDINHMSSLLNGLAPHDRRLIASEGVFSMDGDQAPVGTMAKAAAEHDAWLMIDDAHGFGVMGREGLGVAHDFTQQQVPIVMGTFGKALGTGGAFIAGSQTLINYLINFARHYIYSTAQAPAQAVATLAAVELMVAGEQRQRLQARITQFRQLAKQADLPISTSQSAIQPLLVGCPKRCIKLANALKALGMWVGAIRYPTVPKDSDRLRITLSAAHSEQDIAMLIDALQLAFSKEVA